MKSNKITISLKTCNHVKKTLKETKMMKHKKKQPK